MTAAAVATELREDRHNLVREVDRDVIRDAGHFDRDFGRDVVRADRLHDGLAILERHHVAGRINLDDPGWLGRVLHGARVIAKLTAGVNPRREELLPSITASQQDALPVSIRLQPKLRQLTGVTESLGRSRKKLARSTGQHGQREEAYRQWKTTKRSIVHGQFLMPWGTANRFEIHGEQQPSDMTFPVIVVGLLSSIQGRWPNRESGKFR